MRFIEFSKDCAEIPILFRAHFIAWIRCERNFGAPFLPFHLFLITKSVKIDLARK